MDNAALALELARCVVGTRADFARVFDPVCTTATPGRHRDFKMIALGCATSPDACTHAWREALAGCWAVPIALQGVASGVLDPRALELLAEHLQPEVHPQDGTAAVITRPQGYTPDMLAWLEPQTFARALLTGMQRICRVEVGTGATASYGTGFLVGPQTILTNWHVVHSLMDPAQGSASKNSHEKLCCRFDYFDGSAAQVYGAAEDWLVEWSPMAVAPASGYPNMTGHGKGLLDFAVIRLLGAPGRSRNWYDLGSAVAAPTGAHNPLFVLQHPAGYTLRIGIGDDNTVDGDEIRHKAPTTGGSSGGLCIDREGRLVGLHRAERMQGDAFLHNIAVAATAIAAAAPHAAETDPRYEVRWRLREGAPIIGRDDTGKVLADMLTPKAPKQILIVSGRPSSGKSFTCKLIEDRIDRLALWLVSLKAGDIPLDARELADRILHDAGVPAGQRVLPTSAASATTSIAWLRDHLLTAFREAIEAAALARGGALLWLVIDELDKYTLPETSSREFLYVLYESIRQIPQLRIVLLGLAGSLPVGDIELAEEERLLDPAQIEVEPIETYVKCLSVAIHRAKKDPKKPAPTSDELALAARIAYQVALAPASAESGIYATLRAFIDGPLIKAL